MAHTATSAETQADNAASSQAARDSATTQPDEKIALLSQHVDEAALLYATEQAEAAISLLGSSLSDSLPPASDPERRAWYLLLELHEALGQQAGFDRAALAYAQRFEASPPQWRAAQTNPVVPMQAAQADSTLLLTVGEKLDAGAQTILAQWQQRNPVATSFTLDLAQVAHVDLAGCRLLLAALATLTDWQQHDVQIQLRPCESLLALLQALIKSGRRDEDDAAWRLLIELLRLSGDVERYEDACLAYSLTYEMSPPAAAPPASNAQRKLPASAPANRHLAATQDRHTVRDSHTIRASIASAGSLDAATRRAFLLPEVIAMPLDALLSALREHARQAAVGAQVLTLDARRLQRIDFHAADALQRALAELAAGKTVEWQGVSFLVSTLLELTGGGTLTKMINRMP